MGHITDLNELVEGFHVILAHLHSVSLAVVDGETHAPMDGGLLGADGVVLEADRGTPVEPTHCHGEGRYPFIGIVKKLRTSPETLGVRWS